MGALVAAAMLLVEKVVNPAEQTIIAEVIILQITTQGVGEVVQDPAEVPEQLETLDLLETLELLEIQELLDQQILEVLDKQQHHLLHHR